MSITITEALAELKTIDKRLAKKREFVRQYLHRTDGVKDPLEKDGGSVEVLKRERQGIEDLEKRVVEIRTGIQKANDATKITINGMEKSISEWLVWRREVAPGHQVFLGNLRAQLSSLRDVARRTGVSLINNNVAAEKPQDIVVNISESDLLKEAETLEDTLGQLDGQLSLKNATVAIH